MGKGNPVLFPLSADQFQEDTVPHGGGVVPADALDAKAKSGEYVYRGSIIENPPTGPVFLNIFEMIRGRVPGVWVTGQFFQYQVRIRGAMGPPLVVVDGMSYYGYDDQQINDLLMIIPPMDVDYIQIIKDPGLAAMYGPGAGNGVILIHTKRGSSERSSG